MRFLFTLITLTLVLASCRKDLLHWQRVQKLETHTAQDRLNSIYFLNDSIGFVVGGQRFYNSTILRTEDGGQTWSYTSIGEAPKGIYGITSSPAGILYAAGFDGKLLRSTDQGKTWSFEQLWYLPYKDLALFGEEHGLLVGGISFRAGFTTPFTPGAGFGHFDSLGFELNDIELIDGRSAYIAGHGVVLRTDDSSKTWQMQNIQNDNFTAVQAVGRDEAWTCGYNGSVFHTTNGGQTWQRLRNGNDITDPRYRLLDILFTGRNTGYACGEDGVLIYTDDGGKHWMEFDRFTGSSLRAMIQMKDGSLLVCGDHGSLYRITPKLLY